MTTAARPRITQTPEYQIMPDLSADEYQALLDDIRRRGVQVPIELDEHGDILDGHHRHRACCELGITDYPVVVRSGMTEDQKIEHITALNVARRHLAPDELRRRLLGLRQEGKSIREIAEMVGTSKSAVERALAGVPPGTPALPDTVTGRDGKTYPARRSKSAEESQSCPAPVLTPQPTIPPMQCQISCGDARDLVTKLDEPVHMVITSPPYYQKIDYAGGPNEIGHEKDVQKYLAVLCDILDSILLHPRGSVWVNLGDGRDGRGALRGVPRRFVQEMVERGWLLVDEVVWAKSIALDDGTTIGTCMVEPAPHRLNGNGYEMMYRFVRTAHARECLDRHLRRYVAVSRAAACSLPPAGIDGG